jgi:hypothetical protein
VLAQLAQRAGEGGAQLTEHHRRLNVVGSPPCDLRRGAAKARKNPKGARLLDAVAVTICAYANDRF